MRRLIAGALAALIAAAPVSRASPTGTIKGRVLLRATGSPVADARVILTGGTESGNRSISARHVTGKDGRFSFGDLPTGSDRIYVLDVVYDGGRYASDVITLPSNTVETPVSKTTVRVWEATDDPASILIRRDDIFVAPAEGGVGIIEAVRIVNLSDRAYIGRGTRTTLGFSVPAAAEGEGISIVQASLNIPELIPTDFGFGLTVAIPPGESRITYSYRLPGTAGIYELSRSALYPIVEMSVHASQGIDVRSNRLVPAGDVSIRGQRYDRFSISEGVDPGDALQIVAEARAGFAPGLVAGIVLAGLVLLAGLFVALRRVRRGRPARSRKELLVAIAELDLRHRAGDLDERDWAARRAALKGELEGFEP